MDRTPLCTALRAFAAQNPLRMHMPGHKGRPLPPLPELTALAPLDVTELTPTGDLFAEGGPIGAAEALWAEVFHLPHCLFLTGGSTQGVLSMLTAACPPGSAVLLDRGSHRSAYNALALLDLCPVYLHRSRLDGAGVPGPVDPAEVDRLLAAHPEIKTVCITSPTYYGILSDLPALAAVAHRRGAVLAVDGAHGAHLPFLGGFQLDAADLLVVSAHKTLPALGQGALVFASDRFSQGDLRRAAALYGSSSPSYAIMASLDGARAWLEGSGGDAYRRTAEAVARLRARLPALTDAHAPLDPCRLTVRTGDGFALQRALEERGIFAEMADRGHVVLICTCADTPGDLARLERALDGLLPQFPPPAGASPLPPPPEPEPVLTPRAALFAPRETLPLEETPGRIAAQQIAPYPPGVPVAAPGERLTKKIVAYLRGIGYNSLEGIEVVQAGRNEASGSPVSPEEGYV